MMQFGSKQSSPQLQDGTIQGGRFDGTDESSRFGNSVGSSANGSPSIHGLKQRGPGLHQRQSSGSDSNPYFHPASRLVAVGASPAVSPLGNTIIQPNSSSTSVLGQSGFQPFTGTSPYEFASYNQHDRFPFLGADAHGATAIRGN